MDIYLLQDGQRRGPFRVFQVKEMVDRGEAAVTDLAWHGGLDGWQPLGEVAALVPYLPRPANVPPPLPEGYFENLPGTLPTGQRHTGGRKAAVFHGGDLERDSSTSASCVPRSAASLSPPAG